ncbi:MAG TPA: penicillin-binding protein 2 [Mycobacteriales bacterium]|nr:penicillin-binding protein 2 [Mycobacteriales bacterium]
MSDRSRLRLAVLRILVLSLFLTLLGRLWFLQVMAGERYAKIAKSNRVRPVITAAPRGRILDSVGRQLVRNRTVSVVTIDRTALDRLPDDGDDVVERLGGVLGMSPAEIRARISPCVAKRDRKAKAAPDVPCWNGSPFQPVPIMTDVDDEVAFRIEEHAEDFPGVEASLQAVRHYPNKSLAAHLLGYISPVTEKELADDTDDVLQRTDLTGRAGLEQSYDADLRGRSGVKQYLVDSRGRVTGLAADTPAESGNDLVTTIDARAQRVLETALENAVLKARSMIDKRGNKLPFKAPSAAGVILDVHTGEVVGMASYPSYDPGLFIGGISQRDFAYLNSKEAGVPLISRATQGLFAPASTFKIVSTADAVRRGNSLYGTYNCPGSVKLGPRTFHNFDSARLGPISLRTSLVKSCDTVYYRFAIDEYVADLARIERKQKPAEGLQGMARAFGLGAKTGIDLPSESAGRVLDRAFKKKRWDAMRATYCKQAKAYQDPYLRALSQENCTDGYRYNGGDHVNLSIGQGETLVTPLQLARAYAALANGGKLIKPRLGKAVIDRTGKVVRLVPTEQTGTLPVSAEVLAYIRESLTGVTKPGGTASSAFAGFDFSRLDVAGKTGTAEVNNKQDTSWFASFAPAQAPKYAVVVMVEQAGTGGTIAAPAVREVYEGLYGLGGRSAAMACGLTPRELPVVRPDGSVQPPPPPCPQGGP